MYPESHDRHEPPLSKFFLNFEIMMPFVEHYEILKELLGSELEVFKEQYNNSKRECNSILHVLQFVYPHRVSYSQLYTTFLIAAVIPVTTAENERSFSCMKRVKTY